PKSARREAKGADKGFELDLPRAAITTLDQFDLGEAPAEVRVGSRPVQAIRLDPQRSRLENISLSSLDHLRISWKGSVSEPAKGPPILTATGRISVRINEVHVLTDVDLTLQVLRGETAQWQIAVPGLPAGTDLDVKVAPPDEQRIQSIDRAIG